MEDRDPQFEQIYEAQFSYVWNSLRKMGIPERNLEDVCHEVFVVAYRNLADYDTSRPVQPWLYGIAFRVASDWREKASHAREKLTDPDSPSEPPTALKELSAEQAREVVMDAVQHIDPERRAVFVLNRLDGHAMPEVAEALSIPTNTAYSRLRSAKKTFEKAVRAILDREGSDE